MQMQVNIEYIPEKIKDFIEKFPGNKNIKTNIFRLHKDNSIMCGYFCIGFIDFMLAGKKLTDYTNLFSPYHFKKNDSIILFYFQKGIKVILSKQLTKQTYLNKQNFSQMK